jgi:hypothetical protein
MNQDRADTLCSDVFALVFSRLCRDPEVTGEEAGEVAGQAARTVRLALKEMMGRRPPR